jgi:DNA polymerase-1
MNKQLAIETAKVLKALIELNKISKIIDTFIPIFKDRTIPKQDKVYLHGNFNLNGTISGRMSSSGPNMHQIPSKGSIYAKAIKQCFSSPEGWLICSADFNSLEDRISALTTKDKAKLQVYESGFDGHSLRAYYYFKEQMPDIDPDSVSSINSISIKYPTWRQDSKAPTFALTYGGTHVTLMNNCGFSFKVAKAIEANYHELYKESDNWVQDKLKQASKDGYITAAFGLRVRTPILPQVVYGKHMPYEAQAESRTAGNALGQSWGLLNNRAQNEFLARVAASKHRLNIQPIAAIHDALYWLVRNTPETLKFVNDNLIECMEWQNHPEIAHDTVKLGAELCVHYPDWSAEHSIKNKASLNEIQDILKNLTG